MNLKVAFVHHDVALEREIMKWYNSFECPPELKWMPPRMLFYYWNQYYLFKKLENHE